MSRRGLLNRRRRVLAGTLLVAAGILAAPPAADAASVAVSGGVITYQAAPGEANDVRLHKDFLGDPSFVFGDAPGVTLTAVEPCSDFLGSVFCPATEVTRIRLVTADRADNVFVEASVGDDVTVEADVGEGSSGAIQGVTSESPGRTVVIGGSGPELIDTYGGDDTIAAGGGDDEVRSGEGDDELDLGPGVDEARGGPGWDEIQGGAGADTIYGDDGNDMLSGGADADDLWGERGADFFQGQDGDDVLHDDGMLTGVYRGDVLTGGAGRDTADYGSRGGTWPVTITLDGVANDGADTEADNVGPLGDVEVVEGTGNNDVLIGSQRADELQGGYGNDSMDGGGGNDVLEGFFGTDQLAGGAGNDTLQGLQDDDGLLGEGGDDTLMGGTGNDSIAGGPGADLHDGGLDNDVLLARDGVVDQVRCSLGSDSAEIDSGDLLLDASQCENILRPMSPSNGGGGAGSAGSGTTGGGVVPASPAPPFAISLGATQHLRAALARGIVARATVPAAGRLRATASLGARAASRLRLASARQVAIGRARLNPMAAGDVAMRVKLTRKARRMLRRVRSVKVTLRVRFTPKSGKSMSVSRELTLRR